jgi:ribosomal protein L7Ae-like RNA K-turn-binding protein
MSKGKKNVDLSALSTEQKAAYFERKLASYMGFAAKAGKIASGTNTCIFTMAKGKAGLLIIAEDLADNSREKLMTAARQNEVEVRVFGQADDLAHYTGKYGAGAFCVTDSNFAEVIVQTIDNTSK